MGVVRTKVGLRRVRTLGGASCACWVEDASLCQVNRRQTLLFLGGTGALVLGVPTAWSVYTSLRFPSEKTPEGAYLRIVLAFGDGRVRDCFPYLETDAKNAAFTIHEYRKKSLALVRKSFPEPERSNWEAKYQEQGDAPDPATMWEIMASRRGWDARMRRDLSGIASVERAGKRATVQTVRGTRYPFREANDGLWGLTLFTAELMTDKLKAVHDFDLIARAADDYDHAGTPK
ncbi:MAG: hypothetical protein CSA75_02080 [Sorangium cellulosum]|nr:MAG: hypothetical protein CSA75_02080 [Sorangium cellulosum]